MTAAKIVEEVRRVGDAIAAQSTDQELRAAVAQACTDVLANPQLPGDWWAEQIVLQATKILRETHR